MPSLTCRPSWLPGGALDAETRRRGQTFYAPDGRIPLHPEVISENAGSLLAGQLCSAFVWEFELDAAAEVVSVLVRRAMVRSRAKLNYKGVQAELDAGTAPPLLQLLREVGLQARGAGTGPRRGQPEHAGAGDRAASRRRLPDCGGAAASGGGLERPDFPHDRHGRRLADARWQGGHPAHHAGPGRALPRPLQAPDGRTGETVGREGQLRRVPADAGSHRPPAAGHPAFGRHALPRGRRTRTSTERFRRTPSSPPSARRTPTPPLRCAGSWTVSSWSSARH